MRQLPQRQDRSRKGAYPSPYQRCNLQHLPLQYDNVGGRHIAGHAANPGSGGDKNDRGDGGDGGDRDDDKRQHNGSDVHGNGNDAERHDVCARPVNSRDRGVAKYEFIRASQRSNSVEQAHRIGKT